MGSIKSKILLLRKTPYGESSVIAACLSPTEGRVDFMLKGAKRVSSKKFPVADLFRELDAEWNERGNSTLHTPRSLELVEAFDSIANSPTAYITACSLCDMTLRSSVPGTSCPALYAGIRTAFQRLANGAPPAETALLAEIVNLYEHGVLPEPPLPNGATLAARLVAAGRGIDPIPDLDENTLEALSSWAGALLKQESLVRAR